MGYEKWLEVCLKNLSEVVQDREKFEIYIDGVQDRESPLYSITSLIC